MDRRFPEIQILKLETDSKSWCQKSLEANRLQSKKSGWNMWIFTSWRVWFHIWICIPWRIHGTIVYLPTIHHENQLNTGTSRWWFQRFFYVHPYLGKIPNLTNIFQMGWNHQLEVSIPVPWILWVLFWHAPWDWNIYIVFTYIWLYRLMVRCRCIFPSRLWGHPSIMSGYESDFSLRDLGVSGWIFPKHPKTDENLRK